MIPFSPPYIDQDIIKAVVETLESGWITTGPKTKQFEKELATYCNVPAVLCLNSATAGLEIMLRWFGVGEGDEVILPAYTYSATANVIIHCGAKPVFVDIGSDFNIDVDAIRAKINSKTKVIMPVDFGGLPCDYKKINALTEAFKSIFKPNNLIQEKLGRIFVLSDAAHSFGASYYEKKSGSFTDCSVFSFHAVKNLTTAEGGAVCFNLPSPFSNAEIYKDLCVLTLHGQNKDAHAKIKSGNWKSDILNAGYKMNMTDIQASIGLVQLSKYDNIIQSKRKALFNLYLELLKPFKWAILPDFNSAYRETSYHLFALRIFGITEDQRDAIIDEITANEVAVNVHFIPVPMMSYYKSLGYKIEDYPNTYKQYLNEISLPLNTQLSEEDVRTVVNALHNAVLHVCPNLLFQEKTV